MYWNNNLIFLPPNNTGLIETWDVLKCYYEEYPIYEPSEINRNMRCIEICEHLPSPLPTRPINRNMRCIEIRDYSPYVYVGLSINRNMRCIEIHNRRDWNLCYRWLIETWDVLKFECWSSWCGSKQINRNMRCIEMQRLHTSRTKKCID